jgi:hypothetical protein
MASIFRILFSIMIKFMNYVIKRLNDTMFLRELSYWNVCMFLDDMSSTVSNSQYLNG